MVVDLAQTLEVAVEDVHLAVETDGQGGRRHAHDAGAEDHHLGRLHPGDAAHEHTPSAPGPHEVMGADDGRHPAGHLAHGGEQRQRAVGQLDRLVGDGGIAPGQ